MDVLSHIPRAAAQTGAMLPEPHAETDCGPWQPSLLFVRVRTAEDMSFHSIELESRDPFY